MTLLKTLTVAFLLASLITGCATPRLVGKGRILEVAALEEATPQQRRNDMALGPIPLPYFTPVATPWRLYTVRLLDGRDVKARAEGQLLIGTCVTLHEVAEPQLNTEDFVVGLTPSNGC